MPWETTWVLFLVYAKISEEFFAKNPMIFTVFRVEFPLDILGKHVYSLYIVGGDVVMQRTLCSIILLFFSVSLAFAQARNTRFVAVENAEVKSSTSFFARDVGTLPLGEEVMVLRDSGRWTEVRAGNLTGWVVSASLSPRRTVRAASPVTPSEVALAGKGFGREVENLYRLTSPDYSAVDAMEAIVIPPEELRRFIIEGRLAGAE